MEKLNPCPWCNSKARLERKRQSHKGEDHRKYYYKICCTNPECGADSACWFSPKDQVIESWNVHKHAVKSFELCNPKTVLMLAALAVAKTKAWAG